MLVKCAAIWVTDQVIESRFMLATFADGPMTYRVLSGNVALMPLAGSPGRFRYKPSTLIDYDLDLGHTC